MRPAQKNVSAFATTRFQTIASPQQSKELTASRRSSIVISSSGMATGGRVLHHMEAALPDPKHTDPVRGISGGGHARTPAGRRRAGGQDSRTFDRASARGSPESTPCRRTPIAGEMLRWLGTLPRPPRRLCLVHGEPGPMDALRVLVNDRLGWKAHMPVHAERIDVCWPRPRSQSHEDDRPRRTPTRSTGLGRPKGAGTDAFVVTKTNFSALVSRRSQSQTPWWFLCALWPRRLCALCG